MTSKQCSFYEYVQKIAWEEYNPEIESTEGAVRDEKISLS